MESKLKTFLKNITEMAKFWDKFRWSKLSPATLRRKYLEAKGE